MNIPARYARLYQRRSNFQMCSATGDRPRSEKAVKREYSSACKVFPLLGQRLIRCATGKAKDGRPRMRTELDRKFDEMLTEVTGPGGRLVIARDEDGRAFVENLPGT